ncbi:lipopolysaccharide biosynthesis protein [Streptomyces sp. NPDC050418]|uniref:lipopolysaccharide biosynthesis protein n=1 Tax=Streptomyces sp. NPDC050418 TaxID=3365612 RepID=UPI0037ADE8E8
MGSHTLPSAVKLSLPRRTRRPLPRWWPLPACAALGLAAGAAYGVLAEPQYASTTYLIAVPAKGTDPQVAMGFAQAYGRLATSTSTLAYAQATAGVPARQLASRVQVETSPDSPMLAVTGTSAKPAGAADIANAVADSLALKANKQQTSTNVSLVLFSRAVKSPAPVSPSLPLGAGVGLSGGVLVGSVILLARPRKGREAEGAAVPAPAHESSAAKETQPV